MSKTLGTIKSGVGILRRRFSRFFGNRMPKGDKLTLSQRSSYIWPTASGYLLVGIVLLMLIGATNYQNNLAFSLTFLVVGIGLAAIILTFKNLQAIEFSLLGESEFYVDQSTPVALSIKSLSGKLHSAIGFGWGRKTSVWQNVPAKGIEKIRLKITPTQRGYLRLPRIKVTSVYPFGWFRVWGFFRFESPILVYPKPLEPPSSVESVGDDDYEEGQKQSGSDEFYGLKPYEAGEPLSRIDWKSYARERGVYVREFASFKGRQLCFDWQTYSGYPVESRVSFLTYLVEQAAFQNLGYSMKLPQENIPFGEGEKHRKQCLKALALLDNYETTEDSLVFQESREQD